jgi:hypothetical protein
MRYRLVAACLSLCPAFVCAGSDPWSALASGDVVAIHDTLRDNHPGPPDPSNPHYRQWLQRGLQEALRRAATAHSYGDYLRTLEFYTNGFADGHIQVYQVLTQRLLAWSGFIISAGSATDAAVALAELDTGLKVGDRLLSCDGKDLGKLLAEQTDPYFWNAEIPHARYAQAYRLFYHGRTDPQPRAETCVFSSGSIHLRWRNTNIEELQPKLDRARSLGGHSLAIRDLDGVWLISIPTFNFQSDDATAKAHAFVAELRARASVLRKQAVVLDVRGNGGGDSAWGDEVLAALWGRDWVDYIENEFDETVDWRASPANLVVLRAKAADSRAEAQADEADYYAKAAAAVDDALKSGKLYGRTEEPHRNLTRPANVAFTGRVYLFTDVGCASACLDFADVLLRLPGVSQIGFPTYADTNYIDNTSQLLPSGLAYLSYSLKVYRHRARRNNQWYEPQVAWPGGEVTEQSIAAWVRTLR